MRAHRKTKAFSLVELVIVVVIIGVIAAIAVPRISRGAKGAGEAALRGDLAGLRNSIDMYAAEHNGAWPGDDGLEASLIAQLVQQTDIIGNVGSTPGVHIFGPYLRGGFPPIPVGPNIGARGLIMTTTAPIQTAVVELTATAGWVYNYNIGEIIANTNDLDELSVGYDTY